MPRFGTPETKQLAVYARKLLALSDGGADLHPVIAELPNLVHPWMNRVPSLRPIRPDLDDKPHVPRRDETIPTIPAQRYMIFGDSNLLPRFERILFEASNLIRRLMPFLEVYIREAGPDEPFWRANFWYWFLPSIYSNGDPTQGLYEIENHSRPEFQQVTLSTFAHDLFATSGHALMVLVHKYGSEEFYRSVFPSVPADNQSTKTNKQVGLDKAAEMIRPNREAVDDATERSNRVRTERLNPGSRAVAAAYELNGEGKSVSLKAACERAGVDRKNVRNCYPDAASLIKKLATPDRSVKRGTLDRRTGNFDRVDDDE